MPLRNGSISSCAIPRRSVVLRTNSFCCRSKAIISTARKCARTAKPDYSRVVRKVENHGISSGCLQGGCKSRFAAGPPGSQGKGFGPRPKPFEGSYLRDLFGRISSHPQSHLAELLPDQWKTARQPAPTS